MKIVIPQNREYKAEVVIMNDQDYYTLSENEKIVFGVKRYVDDTSYIMTKELTSSDITEDEHGYLLTLSTNDTNVQAGYYYYDMAVQLDNDELIPIFLADDFVITPAIVRSVTS